ncbi:kinesin-like protein KIF25 [Carcharodon carcharias]|uniref:kinesin-like protein KIF25 n=1 Tax=Carcharodon carcharias TaxID=13397 RepID=UPI001B7EA620|nr:kinesin-like protein KIF25 [Carcharodon carcharias]
MEGKVPSDNLEPWELFTLEVDPSVRRKSEKGRKGGNLGVQQQLQNMATAIVHKHEDAEDLSLYNVCIMAYGQTGSGKTYTMFGPHSKENFILSPEPQLDEGIIPKAARELYRLMSNKPLETHSVKVSIVEVYNNELIDLLAKDNDGTVLGVKRDVVTTITGASDVPSLTYDIPPRQIYQPHQRDFRMICFTMAFKRRAPGELDFSGNSEVSGQAECPVFEKWHEVAQLMNAISITLNSSTQMTANVPNWIQFQQAISYVKLLQSMTASVQEKGHQTSGESEKDNKCQTSQCPYCESDVCIRLQDIAKFHNPMLLIYGHLVRRGARRKEDLLMNLLLGLAKLAIYRSRHVENPTSILNLITHGLQHRTSYPTLVHAHSSRSHLVITITITTKVTAANRSEVQMKSTSESNILRPLQRQSCKQLSSPIADNNSAPLSRSLPAKHFSIESAKFPEYLETKLQLVDLAGSECIGMSGVTGTALRETSFINRSLSALSDVLGALAEQRSHVPYRNSKLTRLLQDSIGGEAKLLVIICVSPAQKYTTESMQSLGFGIRARQVQKGHVRKKSPVIPEDIGGRSSQNNPQGTRQSVSSFTSVQ